MRGPGSSNGIGRVEVFYNKQWGTICRDGWDIQDTDVACRELGFKYSIKTLPRAQVPRGTGPIWFSKVSCKGNEGQFSDCILGGYEKSTCGHNKDVGIECSSTGIAKLNFGLNRLILYFSPPAGIAIVSTVHMAYSTYKFKVFRKLKIYDVLLILKKIAFLLRKIFWKTIYPYDF